MEPRGARVGGQRRLRGTARHDRDSGLLRGLWRRRGRFRGRRAEGEALDLLFQVVRRQVTVELGRRARILTVHEILARLGRVSKTHAGWTARCPAHEDERPSLSVAAAEDGRVLLRCFASCDVEAIVAALRIEMRDLFPDAAPTGGTGGGSSNWGVVQPAVNVLAVASWLRQVRALPEAEVARLFSATTRTGNAVVFRYRDGAGRLLYDKFRPLGDRKVFWRMPRGRPSALYGLADLPKDDRRRVVIVEGELDLHALRAVGIQAVVSVPDGAGSRVTSELVQPITDYQQVHRHRCGRSWRGVGAPPAARAGNATLPPGRFLRRRCAVQGRERRA